MKVVFKKTFSDQSYVPDVSWFTCLNRKQEESVFVSDRSRWIIRSEEMKQIKKIFACTSKSSKKAWMLFISNYNANTDESAIRWKSKIIIFKRPKILYEAANIEEKSYRVNASLTNKSKSVSL